MEQLKLNMIPNGVNPVFHASQYDKGRQIRFVLDETLSGAEVTVSYRAKDGNEYGNVQMSVSGNTITDTIPEEVLTDYGIIEGEVNIDGIGSLNFFVEVEKDAYDGGVITTQTATGAIATFETNIETALVSLKADINPIQDLHGYSKPWSGGGGKNKANKANDLPSGSGITVTVANDGTLTINGTSTEVCYIRGYFNCPDSTATYTLALFNNKAFESGVEFSVRTSDNSSAGGWSRVNATNKTFSFTPSAAPTKWQFQISSGVTFNNAVFKPMIVSGNTAPTDFEPYSNVCPISGFSALNVTRTGKNLIEGIDNNVLAFIGDDIAYLSGTGTIIITHLISGVTYTISGVTGKNRGIIGYFASTPSFNDTAFEYQSFGNPDLTFTANNSGLAYIYIANSIIDTTTAQLEIGNQASDYSPYNGQTVTVQFGQTVCGGVLDVTNGKVLIDRLYKTYNGSENWQISGAQSGKYRVALSEVIDNVLYPISTSEVLDCICNMFEKQNSDSTYRLTNGISYQPNYGLRIYSSAYDTNDITLWKSFLANNPLQVVYKLATPTEITTTPENLTALSGQTNNVYSDTNGDTEVEYYIEV